MQTAILDDFVPFYERAAARFPGYLIGKLVVSLVPGLVFFALRAAVVGDAAFTDWSWLLAVLISTAMLCLYYATYTLHCLLPEMGLLLRRRDAQPGDVFMSPIRRILSDRNFVCAGLGFGLFNCAVGYWLRPPGGTDHATLYVGFFLAGFVCGMAAWGIYGVTVALTEFGRVAKDSLDYAAPDRCGGVQFIGEGLVVFSSVTLIVGVMISLYILTVPWQNATHWAKALQWIWTAFPFLMSLVILIAPAVPLNEALRQYKLDEEERLRCALADISQELARGQAEPDRRKLLRDAATDQQNARKDLFAMGTWPHGISANLKYLGIFLANMLATVSTVHNLFPK